MALEPVRAGERNRGILEFCSRQGGRTRTPIMPKGKVKKKKKKKRKTGGGRKAGEDALGGVLAPYEVAEIKPHFVE